jgi:thiol-disulfide isomerase/thioredoxin
VTRRRWWLWTPLVLLLIAVTSACGSDSPSSTNAGSDAAPPPFADCAALTTPPASGSPSAPTSQNAGAALRGGLPDLTIPCFIGGQQISVHQIKGPAVINLWASWCGPCRLELPIMQQLADRSAGRLHVIGVDTGDGRDAGASFAAAKGVHMPALFDEDSKLQKAIASINLPVTIFVDGNGHASTYRLPLDQKTLPEQVRERTGVAVSL